ncbi:MAG: hypothetical protein ABGW98_01990, partial [Myxococcales bacterium]
TAVNDNDSRITTLQGVAATAQSTADANAAQISNSAPVISGNTLGHTPVAAISPDFSAED